MPSTSSRLAESPVSDSAPVGAAAADPADRWRLKPATDAPAGFVDGGWWPRSDDLAAELPDLLAAVASQLGQVERVSYRIDDWAPADRRIRVDGAVVRLGGFRFQRANTIDLVSRTQRLSMLVVPPSTDPHAAEQALAAAADSENVDDVPTLLAGSSHSVSGG